MAGPEPNDTAMSRPPDRHVTTINMITSEPKYIIINRTDNKTFENVSPFLIKKVVDYACNGAVETCKKTRSGTLLIKTKNSLQAQKLLKLQTFHDFPVRAEEHKNLNTSKGVIYSNDLRNIEEKEILEELKPQNVVEVRKILKKDNNDNNKKTETGLIILSFATITLPDKLWIGYEVINIRPYIPPPMRCFNCLRFGHPSVYCKSPKICAHCSEKEHTKEDEPCTNTQTCINCKYEDDETKHHNAMDKSCPAFIKQKELTAIKTIQKVDHKTARLIYNTRHTHPPMPYALKAALPTHKTPVTDTTTHTTKASKTDTSTPNHTTRQIITYEDSPEEPMDTTASTSKYSTRSELSDELKLKIFNAKSNKLGIHLKAKKKNNQKTKTEKKTKNKISDHTSTMSTDEELDP